MIKDFRKTIRFKKNKKWAVKFVLTFCNYHTVISKSEKLTHPTVYIS